MSVRERLAEHYPMFGLEVRTSRVTLRYPDDADVVAVAELAARGIHDEDQMPFALPWSRVPPPFQQRNTLAFFWDQRATAQRDAWSLPLIVVVDGEIAGTQGLMGLSWEATKTFETGSWLGRRFQGRGIGKEMRAAALHLGFEGFGAERAVSTAFADNPRSIAVTRAMGYRDNGDDRYDRDGEVVIHHRYALDRAAWLEHRRGDIDIVGAEPVVALFGTEHVPGEQPPTT